MSKFEKKIRVGKREGRRQVQNGLDEYYQETGLMISDQNTENPNRNHGIDPNEEMEPFDDGPDIFTKTIMRGNCHTAQNPDVMMPDDYRADQIDMDIMDMEVEECRMREVLEARGPRMRNRVTHEINGFTQEFRPGADYILPIAKNSAPKEMSQNEKFDWAEGFATGVNDIHIEYWLLRNYPWAFQKGYHAGKNHIEGLVDIAAQARYFD